MAGGAASIAGAVGFGMIGDLSMPVRLAIASLVVFLAFFGFYHGARNRKTIQLYISGTGQIRLLKVTEESPCLDANWPHVEKIGEVVRLMDDSTIWPYMLLLRLRSDDGATMRVPIFPDSVACDAFRALSVAIRWVSLQKDSQDAKIF